MSIWPICLAMVQPYLMSSQTSLLGAHLPDAGRAEQRGQQFRRLDDF